MTYDSFKFSVNLNKTGPVCGMMKRLSLKFSSIPNDSAYRFWTADDCLVRKWFTCEKVYDLKAPDVTYYIGKKQVADWLSAQFSCLRLGGSLASILDDQERQLVQSSLKNTKAYQEENLKSLWLGGHFEIDNWKWAYLSGYPITFQSLPKPGESSSSCLQVSVDSAGLLPANCKEAKYPLCEYRLTSVEYFRVSRKDTWMNAENLCHEHGWKMASIFNDYELFRSNRLSLNEVIWIGAQKSDLSWEWVYANEKLRLPVNFNQITQVPESKQNSSCLALYQGNFIPEDCENSHAILCEIRNVVPRI